MEADGTAIGRLLTTNGHFNRNRAGIFAAKEYKTGGKEKGFNDR